MSVFDQLLARVGIGSATVDTQLNKDTFVPGETIEGEILMKGGEASQEIENLYLYITTEYKCEVEDEEGEETTVWEKYILAEHRLGDSFSLEPDQEYNLPFSCQLPYETPITVGDQPVYISTGLDISFALDPQDKDDIQVNPHPAVEKILAILNELGFEVHKAECKQSSLFEDRIPFVQEFEFHPSGSYEDYLDELEVIFFLEEGENLDIFMEIDRQARGLKSWFQEITDTDESHVKISLNSEQLNLDFDELTSFFDRAIQKRLES